MERVAAGVHGELIDQGRRRPQGDLLLANHLHKEVGVGVVVGVRGGVPGAKPDDGLRRVRRAGRSQLQIRKRLDVGPGYFPQR